MSDLIEVATLGELQDIIVANTNVVVEFGAAWCGPCKKFLPHFTEFAKRHPEVVCVKVDVDSDPDFLSEYQIQSVPQVMSFYDGSYVSHLTGRTVLQLEKEISS